MRRNSASVKGNFCSLRRSAVSRLRGFLTMRAGLRGVHSFVRQNSKNALTMLMLLAAVRGLTGHDDLKSLQDAPVFFLGGWCRVFLEFGCEQCCRAGNGDASGCRLSGRRKGLLN